jgi:RNA polymerase sigma-70 factor (ECF subfamily)
MSTLEFNQKVMSFKAPLNYFAISLTQNSEEAKDLLQDTFYKAILYKDKFTDATNLKAWLYTIMKNTFINNYRRNIKTKQIVDTTKDLYFINIPQHNGEVSPLSQIAHKDIKLVLENLEEDLRIPFLMYFEGYKYNEIATLLNEPLGTIKSRIHFVRKLLKEQMSRY